MSWEWSKEETHPCPCGKGTYSESYGSNDWGQRDERHTMNCPDCAKAYEWKNLTPGRPELRARYGWVRRKSS